MATVEQTGVAGTASTSASTVSKNRYAALNSDQFIKIMFSELSNQDPLKPNDSSALLQQLSSLRQIESDTQNQASMASLVRQNQFSSAGSMIGGTISGLSEKNTRVVGQVERVAMTKDGPILILRDGSRVPFNQVDEVRLDLAPSGGGNNPGNGNPGGPGTGNGPGTGPGSTAAQSANSLQVVPTVASGPLSAVVAPKGVQPAVGVAPGVTTTPVTPVTPLSGAGSAGANAK
jgi:flagellar basal-body rod modification protein FlgD